VIWRALQVWLVILILANINGAVREALLIRSLGPVTGRAFSTILLSGIVFLLTWLTIRWIGPTRPGEAFQIGVFWLALTLAFEFLVGHYVFRQPWPALLEDYDLKRGRIWILTLVVVLFAPLVAAHLKGLFRSVS
jgi:hypothetical protein